MSEGASNRVHTRTVRGRAGTIARLRDPDSIAPYLEDAAHYPDGDCAEVCIPHDEAEVAALVTSGQTVLPVGAQSSLTGGATPRGELVLSTARLNAIEAWSRDRVRVGPGVVLSELERALRERDLYYPPQPTYDGATVGGTVATNAAGAATFKYGTTRQWVRALTVVLANGEVLEIERGQVRAGVTKPFELVATDGTVTTVAVPGYTMPPVPKCSSGYYAAPDMDLIDLFIGAEGTLGVIVSIELSLLESRPAFFAGLVPVADDRAAVRLVTALREASMTTWAEHDENGIDVSAVEYMDERCLTLLREDGSDKELGVDLSECRAVLVFQSELDPGTSRAQAFEQLGKAEAPAARSRLASTARLLSGHGVFESTVPVLPGEPSRRDALFRMREAVPEAVNHRIKARQRDVDASITKSGGDVIVPFERFEESLARYRAILERRGLDHAIWGHISDGNVHPNVLPRSAAEAASAREGQLEIGEAAIEMGGCPMSEHGVGRNPVKQELLARLYGCEGIAAMRRVKRALDPRGVLAPGVILAAETSR